jgi:AhpD family alkylhydroperoxidase
MLLSEKQGALIAIGASITANCQPCLQINVEKALGFGATSEEVAAAIEIGNRVRKGAAAKMDAFSSTLATTPGVKLGPVREANGREFLGP